MVERTVMTEPANSTPVRIAMWSGPRTVSTALMRSFENRPDTVVVDEPLYRTRSLFAEEVLPALRSAA